MKALDAFVSLALFATTAIAQAAPHGIFPTLPVFHHTWPTGTHGNEVSYYGGPVISNVKVYAVFWGKNVNTDTQKKIGGFFRATTNSTYFDWLKEYDTNITAVDGHPGTNQSIGRGSYVTAITISPKNQASALNDVDVQAELEGQIAAGILPKPDNDSAYFVFFPPGIQITIDGASSCQEFCAYHEGFVSKHFGNIYYGVMPDIGGTCAQGCGYASTPFDSLTEITSHELIEAVTDPFPTPGDKPAYPQAWNTTDGEETGDLCTGQSTTLTSSFGTYTLQQIWQNSINGCAAGPYLGR